MSGQPPIGDARRPARTFCPCDERRLAAAGHRFAAKRRALRCPATAGAGSADRRQRRKPEAHCSRRPGGFCDFPGQRLPPASSGQIVRHLPALVNISACILPPRERRNSLASALATSGGELLAKSEIRDWGHIWAHRVDCRCWAVARTADSHTHRRSRAAAADARRSTKPRVHSSKLDRTLNS